MLQKKEKYTILLADDDYLNHLYYKEILPPELFDIIFVSNGKDAIFECHENPDIDLVLMDIRMPYVDGKIAINKIREFKKDLPILVQSAYTSSDDNNLMSSMRFIDFISKPVKEKELLKKVNNLLEKNKN